MKLLIDMGNTRLKWAELRSGLTAFGAVQHRGLLLSQVLDQAWQHLAKPSAIYAAKVSSVESERQLNQWVNDHWNIPIHFFKSCKQQLGVTNAYEQPEELGIDRWLAILAAHHLFPGDLAIFDCGTAMTLDVVTSSGVHLGGLIFPGIQAVQTALINKTSIQMPEAPTLNQDIFLANNTKEAILQASLYSAIANIKSLCVDLPKRMKLKFTYVITGGDADKLLPYLPPFEYVPHLILQGLALVVK